MKYQGSNPYLARRVFYYVLTSVIIGTSAIALYTQGNIRLSQAQDLVGADPSETILVDPPSILSSDTGDLVVATDDTDMSNTGQEVQTASVPEIVMLSGEMQSTDLEDQGIGGSNHVSGNQDAGSGVSLEPISHNLGSASGDGSDTGAHDMQTISISSTDIDIDSAEHLNGDSGLDLNIPQAQIGTSVSIGLTGGSEHIGLQTLLLFLPEYPPLYDQSEVYTKQIIIPRSTPLLDADGLLDPQAITSVNLTQTSDLKDPMLSSVIARMNLEYLTQGKSIVGRRSDQQSISMGNATELILAGIQTQDLVLVDQISLLQEQATKMLQDGRSLGELYLYAPNDVDRYSEAWYQQGYRVVIFYASDHQWYVLDPAQDKHIMLLSDYIAQSPYPSYGIAKQGYKPVGDIIPQAGTSCIQQCGQTYCEDPEMIGTASFGIHTLDIKQSILKLAGETDQTGYQVSICITNENQSYQALQSNIQAHQSDNKHMYQFHINEKIDTIPKGSLWISAILHDASNRYIGWHMMPAQVDRD